jgi:hypothetical protein
LPAAAAATAPNLRTCAPHKHRQAAAATAQPANLRAREQQRAMQCTRACHTFITLSSAAHHHGCHGDKTTHLLVRLCCVQNEQASFIKIYCTQLYYQVVHKIPTDAIYAT